MKYLPKRLTFSLAKFSRRFLTSASMSDAGWQAPAERIFQAGLQSVQPQQLIESSQAFEVRGNILQAGGREYELNKNVYIVGFGKAALGVVNCSAEKVGSHLVKGIVSCPKPLREDIPEDVRLFTTLKESLSSRIDVFYGPTNNVPDSTCVEAANSIVGLLEKLNSDRNILLTIITGGGSALLTLPVEGVQLEDVTRITQLMSRAGCNINEMNAVRKQLDQLKGGGLAQRAYPAQVISLILSDIVDDPLDTIASGPTVKNQQNAKDAVAVLEKYELIDKVPQHVMTALLRPRNSFDSFQHVNNVILGSNAVALKAAEAKAVEAGYLPFILTRRLGGDAIEAAQTLAAVVANCLLVMRSEASLENEKALATLLDKLNGGNGNQLVEAMVKNISGCRKICLLAGGETTVRVPEKSGFGGRAAQTSLAAAEALHSLKDRPERIVFLVGSTDGLDGPTDLAGAWVSQQTFSQAKEDGLNSASALATCDAYGFFQKLRQGVNIRQGGLTGTNVMDLFVITVERE